MQTEMQNKITRLLLELNALDKGAISLNDIAADLGVSLRTLQRDMRTIQEAGFPLYCPNPGSYAFMEGFSLEKMKLSDKEASLLVMLSEIANALGAPFASSFSLLQKRLLGTAEESPFFIKITGGQDFPDTAITRELSACIRAREKVVVCYKGGSQACYPLRPLKLIWVEGFWYLLSLNDEGKLLKFRLEKITSATPTGKFFKYNADITKLIQEGTNIWFDQKRDLSIRLWIDARAAQYFKSKAYFPLQKLEQENPDGSLHISCHATSEEEIMATIFHWLPHIKVLSPQDLAAHVKDKLQAYLQELTH